LLYTHWTAKDAGATLAAAEIQQQLLLELDTAKALMVAGTDPCNFTDDETATLTSPTLGDWTLDILLLF